MAIVYAVYLLTANIANIYLGLVLKVGLVAAAYCLSLWLLGSTILREAFTFIVKRKVE